MIARAAAAGEGKAEPPAELRQYWRCQAFPGALPAAGGLDDQPAGLIPRMLAAHNAYLIWPAFWELSRAEFDEHYPRGMELVNFVLRYQAGQALRFAVVDGATGE